MADNKLYYGDNLDVLRRHVADESVDLVYLDPPFNSNADYNVLFARKDGTSAAAQIQAFEDTWRWDMAAAKALDEMVRRGGLFGRYPLGATAHPWRQRHDGISRHDGAAIGRVTSRAS